MKIILKDKNAAEDAVVVETVNSTTNPEVDGVNNEAGAVVAATTEDAVKDTKPEGDGINSTNEGATVAAAETELSPAAATIDTVLTEIVDAAAAIKNEIKSNVVDSNSVARLNTAVEEYTNLEIVNK